MRFLFVSAPLPGHMDWGGMARTARCLLHRGHEVVWATEPAGFRHLEAMGIPTREFSPTGWWWPPPPMPAGLSAEERRRERERRAVAVWLHPERVEPAARALVNLLAEVRPDVLVTEPFIAAAGFAAELAQVPLVVVGWPDVEVSSRIPAHQQQAARLAEQWFAALREALGVQGTYWRVGARPWMRSRHAHVVYFAPEWYAGWRVRVPPTVFVGGVRERAFGDPPAWLTRVGEDRVVLITLGTAFVHDEPFFLMAVDAACANGARVVVATGDAHLAERLRVLTPGDVIVVPWVSYAHLFPRLSAVIHHGGMGTTHAALVYGVPQIVVPRAADQYQQAARVQRTGVGMAFQAREVTEDVLAHALGRLLDEPGWRERSQAMAARMASLGGVERAADVLEEVVLQSG